MDLIGALGEFAFASRLRRLSERLMRDVAKVYEDEKADFEPRWFPVLYLLRAQSPMAVTEIAAALGVTHPAVNQIAGAMMRKGLIVSARDREDDRRRLLALSAKGRALGLRLEPVWDEIAAATRDLIRAEAPEILQAIGRIERDLDRSSIGDRIWAGRLRRGAIEVEILPYTRRFRADFVRLNREWLEEFFEVEPYDAEVLADPEGRIIRAGGAILFAVLKGRPVGTVALIHRDEVTLELAKMAVTASVRGLGAGRRLALAAIERARAAGAHTLFLQTSKKLVAANRLYTDLGFRRIRAGQRIPNPYRRPTYQMKLDLRDIPKGPTRRRKR